MDKGVGRKSAVKYLLSDRDVHVVVSAIQLSPLSRPRDCKECSAVVKAHYTELMHQDL